MKNVGRTGKKKRTFLKKAACSGVDIKKSLILIEFDEDGFDRFVANLE